MAISNIDKVLSVWKRTLSRAKLKTLNSILRNLNRWFSYDKDFDEEVVKEFRTALRSKFKKPKIDFLMSVDPIASEGGLLDFLEDQTVKGLIKRPTSFFTFSKQELETP